MAHGIAERVRASVDPAVAEDRWSPRMSLFFIAGAATLGWLVMLVPLFLWG